MIQHIESKHIQAHRDGISLTEMRMRPIAMEEGQGLVKWLM